MISRLTEVYSSPLTSKTHKKKTTKNKNQKDLTCRLWTRMGIKRLRRNSGGVRKGGALCKLNGGALFFTHHYSTGRKRTFKPFFRPKSGGLQKKKKVFTEIENDFSAENGNFLNFWGFVLKIPPPHQNFLHPPRYGGAPVHLHTLHIPKATTAKELSRFSS